MHKRFELVFLGITNLLQEKKSVYNNRTHLEIRRARHLSCLVIKMFLHIAYFFLKADINFNYKKNK